MRIRKSIAELTDDEMREFVTALLLIKVTIANPDAPPEERITIYDRFVSLHGAVMSVAAPGDPDVNMGHWYPGFLPWHREMLLRVERELNAVSPNGVEIAIPYWPWSSVDATVNRMLQDDRLGRTPPDAGYGPVQSGYFAQDAPTGADRPDWWPEQVNGWRVRGELQTEGTHPGFEQSIYRQVRPAGGLPDPVADIAPGLELPNYHWFWRWLEEGQRTHNSMHNWIGGTLSNPTFSPMDPVFLLNHANVDRLWALWQDAGHGGSEHYPENHDWDDQPAPALGEPARRPIPIGHKLHDLMWPWVGGEPGYSSNMPSVLGLPHLAAWAGDYTGEPGRRPVDVLDTTQTGNLTEAYVYQEPTVRFSAVRKVLDTAMAAWEREHGETPDLAGHGADFGWETPEQLRSSRPRGRQLITDDLVGVGRADETHLVRVLTSGLPGFAPRMPRSGPFLSSAEIGLIAKWIDDGCLA